MARRLLYFPSSPVAGKAASRAYPRGALNPKGIFDEVHFVLEPKDVPDVAGLEIAAAGARVVLHGWHAGRRTFFASLGWRPGLLGPWVGPIVSLADRLRPSVLFAEGLQVNAFAAHAVRVRLGIPLVVRLQHDPDEDPRHLSTEIVPQVAARAIGGVQREVVRAADVRLLSSAAIVPFLLRHGVEDFEILPEPVEAAALRRKSSWALGSPIRIVTVGPQDGERDPARIIRALHGVANAELTVVGDGSRHEHLVRETAVLGLGHRVRFLRSVDHRELCRLLSEHDLFALHSEFGGVAEGLLEAMLTGLPIVVSQRRGSSVPELRGRHVLVVDDTPTAFAAGLNRLVADAAGREALGSYCADVAWSRWNPERTEARMAEIFSGLAKGSSTVSGGE